MMNAILYVRMYLAYELTSVLSVRDGNVCLIVFMFVDVRLLYLEQTYGIPEACWCARGIQGGVSL